MAGGSTLLLLALTNPSLLDLTCGKISPPCPLYRLPMLLTPVTVNAPERERDGARESNGGEEGMEQQFERARGEASIG